jgi:proteasome lid subunit RPN8/RPN11
MAASPSIQHATNFNHTRLSTLDHECQGCPSREERAAIFESDPPIGPWLSKIDVESLKDADEK